MTEIGSQTENERVDYLTAIVLCQIPDQTTLSQMQVSDQQTEVVPLNFDGILSMQEELKSQKVRIPRSEGWDLDGSQTRENVRETYRKVRKRNAATGFDTKAYILSKRDENATFKSDDGIVFIAEDEFPYHVDHSNDAKHLDVWVLGEIEKETPAKRVAQTIAKFLVRKGLGEHDFVLIQNPPTAKTIPEVEHLHLFIRVASG